MTSSSTAPSSNSDEEASRNRALESPLPAAALVAFGAAEAPAKPPIGAGMRNVLPQRHGTGEPGGPGAGVKTVWQEGHLTFITITRVR